MHTVEQSGSDLITSKIFNRSTESYRVQSSGGLMCDYSRKSKSFRIFNPHIGQEIEVLDVHKFKECSDLHWWCFSYSPSTKEYKILKFGIVTSEDEKKTMVFQRDVAAITTLGSNVWSEIQNVPPGLSSLHLIECQGTLFWITKSGLVSFDIVSEKFHEIPGPPNQPIHGRRVVNYNKLIRSMGHTVGYMKNCRLWLLEDKSKGIWINKYDISTPPLDKYAHGLIGISGSDGLFGFNISSNSVFILDMRRTPFRGIEIKLEKYVGAKTRGMIWFTAPHVSSLVSPVRVMEMGSRLPTGSDQQIYDDSDVMDISLERKF